jgi:hypothetical protein
MMNDKFNCLWFLPFSEFKNDVNTEIALINGFHTFGHSNTVVRCGGYLNTYCTPMNGNRLKEESPNLIKAIICKSCKQKGNTANKIINGNFIDQTNFISMEDRLSIENIINEVDFRHWKDFKFKNIPIGRYASYEVILNNKINPNELNEGKFHEKYRISLKNSLLCAISFAKIIELTRFDVLFVRNSLYSINRVACWMANDRNIKAYSMQNEGVLGDGVRRLYINKWDKNPKELYSSTKFLTILNNDVEKSTNKFVEKYTTDKEKSKSLLIYSEPSKNLSTRKIRNNIGIKNQQKIILVTLSSGDEISAAETIGVIPDRNESDIFLNQNAWIKFLLNFADENPDLNFIFRIHPREKRNRRDNVESSNYPKLLKILGQVPNNVYVNNPEDKVSIYDIFSISDININFGSSTGLDTLAMGIPTITQDTHLNLGYPGEIGNIALSKNDYSRLIRELINSRPDVHSQHRAGKWIYFLTNYATLSVGDEGSKHGISQLEEYFKNLIFKLGKGIIFLNLLKKLVSILSNSINLRFDIKEQKIVDIENQLSQLFNTILQNESHYIKKV